VVAWEHLDSVWLCCCAGVRLWHKLAVRYGQPRLVTYWRLSSPIAAATARHSVLCALWLRLVEEAQAEDAYLAGALGLFQLLAPAGLGDC
jgi:secreted Zn-dependent insulinase-like peptidase